MRRSVAHAATLAVLIALLAPASPSPAVAADGVAATVTRIAGADRYETSARVSAGTWSAGVPVAYLASGADYADALAAGPAAAAGGGPVLLTAPTALPSAIRAELIRLAPDRVVIVGGTAAVSSAVQGQVAALGLPIDRVGGSDRYATAAAVATAAFPGPVPVVYVALGSSFPDALAAGAAAAHQGGPVLLTEASRLPTATVEALNALQPGEIVVAGGSAAVSDGVLTQLAGSAARVERVGGSDRYATAAAIATEAFETAPTAVVATGQSFPDALSSVPAAHVRTAPLLLTPQACATAGPVAAANALNVTASLAIGGHQVVSTTAAGLLPCPPAPTITSLVPRTIPTSPGYAIVDGTVQHLPITLSPLARLSVPAAPVAGQRLLALDMRVGVPVRQAVSIVGWCHPYTPTVQTAPGADQIGATLTIGQNAVPGTTTAETLSRHISGRVPFAVPAGVDLSCELAIAPRTEGYTGSWLAISSGAFALAAAPVVGRGLPSTPILVGDGPGGVAQATLAPAEVTGAAASEATHADADLSLTNCYAGYGPCAVEGTADAVVDARVELTRYRSDGTVCAVLKGATMRIVITSPVHHRRDRLPAAIDTSPAPCGTRAVAQIRLTHVSGNTVSVEGAWQTISWVETS